MSLGYTLAARRDLTRIEADALHAQATADRAQHTSNLPGVHREDPSASCGSPAARSCSRMLSCRRSQAINSTAMPAACASAAWRASRGCSLRPVAFAVAMISISVALVVRPAERAAASTSP